MKTTWQKAGVCIYSNHLGPAGALTEILGVDSPSEMSFRDHVCGQFIMCVSFGLGEHALQFHFGPLAFLAFQDDQNPLSERNDWEGKQPPPGPGRARRCCRVPRSYLEARWKHKNISRTLEL